MERLAALSGETRRSGAARRFVVFVAALGLLLQSYVTQTHIHSAVSEAGGIFHTTGHTPAKAPLNKAVGCPLCQAIAQAGAFVAPSAPLIYLSFEWFRAAPSGFAAATASRDVTYDWRSRAPPRR
jgi:hypothetical protein